MELEEIMKKLEETVEKMEQSPLTLQESYQCFSQGSGREKDQDTDGRRESR